MSVAPSESIAAGVDGILGDLEALYKDVHGHPELSMREKRTAGIAAEPCGQRGSTSRRASARPGVVGLRPRRRRREYRG